MRNFKTVKKKPAGARKIQFYFYSHFECSELRIGSKKSMQTFFVQSFSTTLRVMDVRAENRRRPHQKVRFPAAPVVGRNFLTPEHPGVRVGNVRGKSGPKSLCFCCFFFPEISGPFVTWPQLGPFFVPACPRLTAMNGY